MPNETGDRPATPNGAEVPVLQELPSSADAPSVTVRRGLTGVLACCGRLASAINMGASDEVSAIAIKAANLWMDTLRAYGRLVAGNDHPTILAYRALNSIESTYRKLLDLFRNASEQIRAPDMKETLAKLETEMTIARTHH